MYLNVFLFPLNWPINWRRARGKGDVRAIDLVVGLLIRFGRNEYYSKMEQIFCEWGLGSGGKKRPARSYSL